MAAPRLVEIWLLTIAGNRSRKILGLTHRMGDSGSDDLDRLIYAERTESLPPSHFYRFSAS
ncbi:MAG TPA: hypothetical protein VK514_10210 [Candidatus Acidoferrum sp.]|nr:hypothetical protein [Candidatus Acidoferrum sp.]